MPHPSSDLHSWFTHVRERISHATSSVTGDGMRSSISSVGTSNTSDCVILAISSIMRHEQYEQLLPLCQDLFNALKEDGDVGASGTAAVISIVKEEVCHILPSLIHTYLSLNLAVTTEGISGKSAGGSSSGPGILSAVNSSGAAPGGAPPSSSKHHKRRTLKASAVDMLQTVLLAVYNLCAASRASSTPALDGAFFRPYLETDSIYHSSQNYTHSNNGKGATMSVSSPPGGGSTVVPDLILPASTVTATAASSANEYGHMRSSSGRRVAADSVVLGGRHYPVYDSLTAENMWSIVCANIALYNTCLHRHSRLSLATYCQLSEFLVALKAKGPRILAVPETLLVELCTGLYFHMFNQGATEAYRAFRAMEIRATYEVMPGLLLILNSIRNSLESNPSGRPHDGPVGLCEVPSTSHPENWDHQTVTNATFQTEKLPDDISPVTSEEVKTKLEPNGKKATEHVEVAHRKQKRSTAEISNHSFVPSVHEKVLPAVVPNHPPMYNPITRTMSIKGPAFGRKQKSSNNGEPQSEEEEEDSSTEMNGAIEQGELHTTRQEESVM